jgi:hypothetical protein
MNALVIDNFIDTAGTLATEHTPDLGGPIAAVSSAAAVITASNRMRGQSQGTLNYASLPATQIYSVEGTMYVASNANGFGVSLSGMLLSYSETNGYWNLAGPGLPSGQHVDQVLNPGETHKFKLAINSSMVTASIDGAAIIQKTCAATIPQGPVGIFFQGQDTDSTGYQLESLFAIDTGSTAVAGTDLQIQAAAGQELYCVAISPAGWWWNTVNGAFEAFASANWSQYVVSLVEAVANSGRYFGSVPAGLTTGLALLSLYAQNGASAASTDSQVLDGQTPVVYALDWSGTTVNSISPLGSADADLRQLSLPAKQDSLAVAQGILNQLYTARMKLATSAYVSVSVDGQMVTFNNPAVLDEQIQFWERKCAVLSGRRRRFSSLRMDRF